MKTFWNRLKESFIEEPAISLLCVLAGLIILSIFLALSIVYPMLILIIVLLIIIFIAAVSFIEYKVNASENNRDN